MIIYLQIYQFQVGDEILDQIFTTKNVRNQQKIFLIPRNNNLQLIYFLNHLILKNESLLNHLNKPHHLLNQWLSLPQLILNWHKQQKLIPIKYHKHHFNNHNNNGSCLNSINLSMIIVEKFKQNSRRLCQLYKHLHLWK